jgi:hypothetical protein
VLSHNTVETRGLLHPADFLSKANSVGWNASANDKNAGSGEYGSCCSEMDIWEANVVSAAYTP